VLLPAQASIYLAIKGNASLSRSPNPLSMSATINSCLCFLESFSRARFRETRLAILRDQNRLFVAAIRELAHNAVYNPNLSLPPNERRLLRHRRRLFEDLASRRQSLGTKTRLIKSNLNLIAVLVSSLLRHYHRATAATST
jgi:hypothetical protein